MDGEIDLFLSVCSRLLCLVCLLGLPARSTCSRCYSFNRSVLSLTRSPRLTRAQTEVIAEELGYYPVSINDAGKTIYAPARVKSSSTDQAIALATHLRDNGVVIYSAFWCPHCRNQREMFGKEAWTILTSRECSEQGIKFSGTCDGIDGYPAWTGMGGVGGVRSGEMELGKIAEFSGFKGFEQSKEPVQLLPGGNCKLK